MITSISNSKVKNVINLIGRSKTRKEQHSFVVEGVKMFLEAPPERIKEIYVSESLLKRSLSDKGKLFEKLQELEYEVVADEVFGKMSDTKTPQGILCVVEQFSYTLPEILAPANGLWMVLEDIQDPGNLGTILRTGEGAGIHGVIMTQNTVDIYNPKTIRATMGSIYRVPFIYVEKIQLAIAYMKELGIKIYAAHLSGRNFYDYIDFREKTAFLIGNEGNGLKEETAKLAAAYLKIPMEGEVESLNAGVAAAVLMYEAKRQRSQLPKIR